VSSRIIKSGTGKPIVEAPVYDARLEAQELVDHAREEAEQLRAQSQAESERLKRQAEAEGRERGLAAVTELLAGARVAAARARQGSEAELRTLAVRIAEKILGRELSLRPEAVVDVAAEALRFGGEPRELTVRAHPDDLAALERGKPRLVERCRAGGAVVLRADPSVGRGGCIIESELGVVDARLSVQLEAIERALRGE
jgi:flagellar biosynthesis/type III secretory pathway protein FliH